ncbi:MAG TPA: 30S ribosomal protein S27ae, partial [Nitrosopumilus sp.]|nr:30S ribosomal protein S27ae [Nitrosopumilus sp.]
MPVGKKGSKGSSPKVYKYFKIDGDKTTKLKKNCSRCGKGVAMSE